MCDKHDVAAIRGCLHSDHGCQMYDKVESSVVALADVLDRDTPVMPEVVEDRQKAGGITLWTGDFEVRDAALGTCRGWHCGVALLL